MYENCNTMKNAYLQVLLEHFIVKEGVRVPLYIPVNNRDAFVNMLDDYDEFTPLFEANFRKSDKTDSKVFKDDIIECFAFSPLNWRWRSILTEIKKKGITYDKNVKGSGDKDRGKRGAILGYERIPVGEEEWK